MADLKTCPFCGDYAQMEKDGLGTFWVECVYCRARGGDRKMEPAAAEDWNRRSKKRKLKAINQHQRGLLEAVRDTNRSPVTSTRMGSLSVGRTVAWAKRRLLIEIIAGTMHGYRLTERGTNALATGMARKHL